MGMGMRYGYGYGYGGTLWGEGARSDVVFVRGPGLGHGAPKPRQRVVENRMLKPRYPTTTKPYLLSNDALQWQVTESQTNRQVQRQRHRE